jgi:hypothetical protein
MTAALAKLLDDQRGIALRGDPLKVAAARTVERAVHHGQLRLVYPRTYVATAALTEDPDLLLHAAVVFAEGTAALSHTSALQVWRVPVPPGQPVHLMTGTRSIRSTRRLRVHRRRRFTLDAPGVVERDGLPVTNLGTSLVDSWAVLDPLDRRAPVIEAVANRMTTPERLHRVAVVRTRLAGRRDLLGLVELLGAGCRSPLELWGYQHVFAGPEFAALQWQVPVRLRGRVIYLDALDPATGVNFELDGAAWHGAAADRERDLRRDAALPALGLVVVRFTARRLRNEAPLVRREALDVIAARPRGWRLPPSARITV